MSAPLDRRDFLGSALAFGALPAAAGAAIVSAPQVSATTRYRFISLARIQQGWSRAQKMLEDFKQEFTAKAEGLAQRAKEVEKKQTEAKSFIGSGNTPEARKRLKELATSVAELQFEEQDLKREKEERKLRILLSEYQAIQEVAAKWAQQNSVDAIFTFQDEDPSDEDLQARYQRAILRQVLWYSKDLDATEDVLKLLEASSPTIGKPSPAGGSNTSSQPGKR